MRLDRLTYWIGGVALALTLTVAGTLGVVLRHGDVIGGRLMIVGARLAQAGGGRIVVDGDALEALIDERVAARSVDEMARPVVVRRGGK